MPKIKTENLTFYIGILASCKIRIRIRKYKLYENHCRKLVSPCWNIALPGVIDTDYQLGNRVAAPQNREYVWKPKHFIEWLLVLSYSGLILKDNNNNNNKEIKQQQQIIPAVPLRAETTLE